MNHQHNNQPGHDPKMMWWMIVGCLILPIILLLALGKINIIDKNWTWLILGAIFIAVHLVMFFSHGKHKKRL